MFNKIITGIEKEFQTTNFKNHQIEIVLQEIMQCSEKITLKKNISNILSTEFNNDFSPKQLYIINEIFPLNRIVAQKGYRPEFKLIDYPKYIKKDYSNIIDSVSKKLAIITAFSIGGALGYLFSIFVGWSPFIPVIALGLYTPVILLSEENSGLEKIIKFFVKKPTDFFNTLKLINHCTLKQLKIPIIFLINNNKIKKEKPYFSKIENDFWVSLKNNEFETAANYYSMLTGNNNSLENQILLFLKKHSKILPKNIISVYLNSLILSGNNNTLGSIFSIIKSTFVQKCPESIQTELVKLLTTKKIETDKFLGVLKYMCTKTNISISNLAKIISYQIPISERKIITSPAITIEHPATEGQWHGGYFTRYQEARGDEWFEEGQPGWTEIIKNEECFFEKYYKKELINKLENSIPKESIDEMKNIFKEINPLLAQMF